MNRSRKKRNRREIRRQRQLREKNQRIAVHGEEKYTEEEIPLRLRLKKHAVEFSLIAFVIIGVLFVISLGPDKKSVQELRESFAPFLNKRSLEWDEEFLQGYKIIVFTDKNIIQTSFDTLPDDLKINWKKMSVVRIQANQLSGTTEKIKIAINDITYTPEDVSGMTVTVILSRQKGASARLARLGKFELVAKIGEDDGRQLFFLLGLRSL